MKSENEQLQSLNKNYKSIIYLKYARHFFKTTKGAISLKMALFEWLESHANTEVNCTRAQVQSAHPDVFAGAERIGVAPSRDWQRKQG